MWSSGFIGAELGTRVAPADTLLGWRYVAAALLVGTWAAVRGVRPDRRTWPRLALVGVLCQCLYLGGVVTGVGLGVPPGTAALVAALQPLLVAVVAGPLLGERTSVWQRVGLVLGVVGVALVVAGDLGAGAPLLGYALVVGGMLALASGTLLERRLRLPVSLLESLTVQTLTAAVFFLLVATRRRAPAAAGRPAVLVGGAVGGRAVDVRRLRLLPGGAAAQRRDPGQHAAVPDPADHRAVGVPDVRHPARAAGAARRGRVRAGRVPGRTADGPPVTRAARV